MKMKIDIVKHLKDAYSFNSKNSNSSVHYQVVLLEKQVRLAAIIVASITSEMADERLRLPRMAGLGQYLNFLRNASENCEINGDTSGIAELSSNIYANVYRKYDAENKKSLKQLRDYLSHGGIEPEDETLQKTLHAACEENFQLIDNYLRENGGITSAGTNLVLGSTVLISPLLRLRENTLCIFQSCTNSSVTYYTLDPKNPEYVEIYAKSVGHPILSYVEQGVDSQRHEVIRDFQKYIYKDLQGFSEKNTPIRFLAEHSPFEVEWSRKTSSGTEHRIDRFNLHPDNQRQWYSGEFWVSYQMFLKQISNWEVSKARLSQELEDIRSTVSETETVTFGFSEEFVLPPSGGDKFRTLETYGSSFDEMRDLNITDLSKFLIQSTITVTGVPQVFFVTGEAGIGKTYRLINTAWNRFLTEPESGDHQSTIRNSPVYLYLSCNGRGLESIKDVIKAAVVETQNLDYDSVLAMCRNGELILLVDGFDELIGGAGYGDALQLLGPVFEELGDRGTIVVSARSSYLANQYEKSLRTAQNQGIFVDHWILELQRWDVHFVKQLFELNSSWAPYKDSLLDSDYELLGVPFFARIFDVYARTNTHSMEFESLRSILLTSYLEREIKKLETKGGKAVVTVRDLQRIFEEIAGMIFDGASRYLDLEEFMLACQSALGLESFKGDEKMLQDRLTVLCGMSAHLDDEGTPLFGFDHDLFYESFLAEYICRNYLFGGVDNTALLGIFERDVLGEATVDALVVEHPREVLRAISLVAGFVESQTSNLGSNVSAMVAAVLRQRIPLTQLGQEVFRLQLDNVDLHGQSISNFSIIECRIRKLIISSKQCQNLVLSDSRIEILELRTSDASLPLDIEIKGEFGIAEIQQIDDRSMALVKHVYGRNNVLEFLNGLGVRGLEIEMQNLAKSISSPFRDFVVDVIERFSTRFERAFVIETKSRVPGDGAIKWLTRPNDPLWGRFVSALIQSDCGAEKRINASGPAKSLVTILINPKEILLMDQSEDLRIHEFWRLIDLAEA
ncbi:NACHT domain-containing protein [Kocuria marina]|uniref:NACHT domain-containing protein n=1 Tax=Kocuria marina TaxID=223184 RepID=UPI0022E2C748|nr:hypothetical protein [Kocuria marina]